uniref:Uncharacterized protein n=1 Tax=Palpitomonas bilix TaxID=652834 RepID=A0A7S3GCL2_9EUKA|mmetsp:Transcript_43520/g.113314  ORF Transcript_43520/g.113314 Transcript_43520/m.113314 type:complete len:127 (+) Transcript_43520:868-1248(+)
MVLLFALLRASCSHLLLSFLPCLNLPSPSFEAGIEVVGEKIAGVLGLTQSKYEWVIDEYERIQEQKEDARKRRQRRREREREEIARELSAREGGSRDMDGNGDQVAPATEARVTGEKGEEQQAPQL